MRRVFSRFGEVVDVQHQSASKVLVTMLEIPQALFAQQYLNFSLLPASDAYLKVRLLTEEENIASKPAPLQAPTREPFGETRKGENQSVAFSSSCTSQNKFTCRYEIQIPNDNGFQVARRIIGFRVSLPGSSCL